MSDERFTWKTEKLQHLDDEVLMVVDNENKEWKGHILNIVDKLNEQQEFIEELQVSDEMGWKRAEHFEKKCPKELHNKKMYIKRLEYKVQKFKEENEQLKKARDESDKFIIKKGLEAEFLNWCVAEAENDE